MARLRALPALGGAILLATPALAQDAKPECYTVESLQAVLAGRFGESVAFSGATKSGLSITLFASAAGTWTIATIDTDGIACLVAIGTNGRLPKGPVFIPLIPEDPA